MRAAALLLCGLARSLAAPAPSVGFPVTNASAPGTGRTAAIVVRGDVFRDCGHGIRCGALGPHPSLAAARSVAARVVGPLARAGYAVSTYVATYACPDRRPGEWAAYLEALGGAAAVDAPFFRSGETQRDTLLRALALVPRPADFVVVARADLLFVADLFPPSVLASTHDVLFHADLAGGVAYDPRRAPARTPGPITDKVQVLRGRAGAAGFVDAVLNDGCFNFDVDDDDGGGYLSGEGCYAPVAARVGSVGFLRDLVPGTRPGTFGDNEDGDALYRVLPRSLGALPPGARASLLGGDAGPYATGACGKGRAWAAARAELR